MYTINNFTTYTETIKKSKFISYLYPINNLNQAKEILTELKNKYSDATHVCYSYILDENTYKYYDDGEPSNSAGMPIYQCLKNNKLVYVLCVVIRYYGGIKLGVGGLTHAYSNGALNCLKHATIIEYKKTDTYIIETDYSSFDTLNYYLNKKGIAIINKQFLDKIFISINLNQEELQELNSSFSHLIITKI